MPVLAGYLACYSHNLIRPQRYNYQDSTANWFHSRWERKQQKRAEIWTVAVKKIFSQSWAGPQELTRYVGDDLTDCCDATLGNITFWLHNWAEQQQKPYFSSFFTFSSKLFTVPPPVFDDVIACSSLFDDDESLVFVRIMLYSEAVQLELWHCLVYRMENISHEFFFIN